MTPLIAHTIDGGEWKNTVAEAAALLWLRTIQVPVTVVGSQEFHFGAALMYENDEDFIEAFDLAVSDALRVHGMTAATGSLVSVQLPYRFML